MAECSRHDNMVDEISRIKERLSANESEVRNGWKVIRKTEERVETLERATAESGEKINSIFRMLKDLTKAIQNIDEKLDEYMTDVRHELKDSNRRIYELETRSAINSNNISWDWKMILAVGTVITFLASVLVQIVVGG